MAYTQMSQFAPENNASDREQTLLDESLQSLEDFARFFQHDFGTPKLSFIASENPDLFKAFKNFHPVKMATTFAGLLTHPALQSNCLRLETLIHLALVCCEGNKTPPAQFICHVFNAMSNGTCGRLEDPAEDVFISSVYSSRGNYRILEGIWESAGFFLQRFVNIIEQLPDSGNLDRFKESIHALLKLSDLLCERLGLNRYNLGNAIPEAHLPRKLANDLATARRAVRFTREELILAGIEIRNLSPFIFKPRNREALLNQTISHTDLERRPVGLDGDDLVFLLPTATSIAVRRFVLEVLGAGPNRQQILSILASEYSETLSNTPLLGDRQRGPIMLTRENSGVFSSVLREVDVGRYLCLVFFMDTLDGFEDDGFSGTFQGLADMADAIDDRIDRAIEMAGKNPAFRSGVVLLVGCGIGRGASIPLNNKLRPGWRFDSISAPDFCTLSWTPHMKALNLWRIYAAEAKLKSRGIELQNTNGLLNLVAWTRSLEGHLVPHANIPLEMATRNGMLMVTQNALLELRHEVASSWDPHAEQDVDRNWYFVRQEGQSHFDEDRNCPIYATFDQEPTGHPRGLCITKQRTWWFELSLADGTPAAVCYERWRMLATWLRRAAPTLDNAFPTLPSGPILWRSSFSAPLEYPNLQMQAGTADDAHNAINLRVIRSRRVVSVEVSEGFNQALFNSENVAEAALIDTLIRGIADLADIGPDSYDHSALATRIVGSPEARQSHIFVARDYLDFMDCLSDTDPITINRYDDAELKLGLGWRVQDIAAGSEISGKDSCTAFLNSLVTTLEDELCIEVRKYGRKELIEALLFNCEVANWHRRHWKKTAAAVLALHDDKQATLSTMGQHEFKLNGVLQASRILIEMAICESPQEGQFSPGKLDLSCLMARAALLFHLGGWSDAIRWDVMKPALTIRPLGDVHANHDFINNIAEKFAGATSEIRFRQAAESYANNLKERAIAAETTDDMEGRFLAAWSDEFGASLHDFRRFVDELEELGLQERKPVLYIPRSQLVELLPDRSASDAIVRTLTLEPRASWRNIPDGHEDKDRQPWRFRRRLSVVRRPLLQTNGEPDPMLLIAPGMVRESFGYLVSNYHEGNFPDWQLGPAMQAFVGHSRQKRGTEFNEAVAERLRQLGWQVECEIKLTKLLRKNLGRDWGDVDVFAWNTSSQRILIIECKDVHFRKTYGEIAEQLSDFRGEIKSNGKPDMLKKHLDRVERMRENISAVRDFVSLPDASTIESHLVFRNPVPMQYAAQNIGKQVHVSIFDSLDKI